MSQKLLKITWKGWLLVAIIGIASFSILMVLFYPSSPIAQRLGTAPRESQTIQSNVTTNAWYDLSAPTTSTDKYAAIWPWGQGFQNARGYLFKQTSLDESALAAYFEVGSLYTVLGQAKIIYGTQMLSGQKCYGLLWLNSDGKWYFRNPIGINETTFLLIVDDIQSGKNIVTY